MKFSPIDVPRLPNIEPFNGNFLYAASTDDEIAKMNKTTNVSDKTVLIDNILFDDYWIFLVIIKTDEAELITTCWTSSLLYNARLLENVIRFCACFIVWRRNYEEIIELLVDNSMRFISILPQFFSFIIKTSTEKNKKKLNILNGFWVKIYLKWRKRSTCRVSRFRNKFKKEILNKKYFKISHVSWKFTRNLIKKKCSTAKFAQLIKNNFLSNVQLIMNRSMKHKYFVFWISKSTLSSFWNHSLRFRSIQSNFLADQTNDFS